MSQRRFWVNTINSAIDAAVAELYEAHKSCSNQNPLRCDRRHKQLINQLLVYEASILRKAKDNLIAELTALRDDWFIDENMIPENSAYWLKEGINRSIRFIEEGNK